jgi:hypothetical protein
MPSPATAEIGPVMILAFKGQIRFLAAKRSMDFPREAQRH